MIQGELKNAQALHKAGNSFVRDEVVKDRLQEVGKPSF